MNIFTRIYKGTKRRLDFSDAARIKRIVKNPPPVQQDLILFTSSEDYSGNPKALFLYMIEHGYNERYRFVWLFERRENYFEFDIPNVSSVCMYLPGEGRERSFAAQKAALSARYLFYSHNLNWVRNFRKEQTYIDLWHGCGYKGELKRDKTRVCYDHLMVTGKKYIDIFRDVMNDPDGSILDLGYPRNEFFTSSRSNAAAYMETLKKKAGAQKSVIWMPTYRRSPVERLSTDVQLGDTGLPVVYTDADLLAVDEKCRESGVLLIIKKHNLQTDYETGCPQLSNIVFAGSDTLRSEGVDLYEFMAKTDALLTDYSSAAIDYLLLDRPIGYTLDDYDEYEAARGFSFEPVLDYMPGHHITDMEGLAEFIEDIGAGSDPHREWRRRVLPEMQTYTDGFSKRILDYFGI